MSSLSNSSHRLHTRLATLVWPWFGLKCAYDVTSDPTRLDPTLSIALGHFLIEQWPTAEAEKQR